jgi:hypothetical protein
MELELVPFKIQEQRDGIKLQTKREKNKTVRFKLKSSAIKDARLKFTEIKIGIGIPAKSIEEVRI